MFPKVGEHIEQSIAHFSWRRERAPMPSIRPESPAPIQQIIHVASDAHRQASNTARKRAFVRSFDDEVHVIVLHGKVHDTKPIRIALDRP
jgi:hypothetical protein